MDTTSPEITIPIGKTALYTCAERAHECKSQKVPLFDDPKASILAGNQGFDLLQQFHGVHQGARAQAFTTSVAIRTKYFDEVILWAVKEEGIKQVVILAAGMDTRVYRLQLDADTAVYELDFKQVLDYKMSVLSSCGAMHSLPSCKYIPLGLDLTQPLWPLELKNSGYDPTKRAIWLIEGLLVYLKDEDIFSVFSKVTGLMSEGSLLIGDFMNRSYLKSKITEGFRSIFESFHSPFINGADYLPFTNLLQNFGIISRISALGETHNNFSNRVPANQAKVAEKYPIHELAFQNVPRHFFFLGEKAVDEKSLAITRKFGEIPKPSGISFGSHLSSSPKNPEKEELKKLIKKSIIK